MRLARTAALAVAIASLGTASTANGASTPPAKGNCLSSFINGGSQGSLVSSDPGGRQADGTLGAFLHEERGCII